MTDVFGDALLRYWHGERNQPLLVRRDDGHVSSSSPSIWVEDALWPVEAAVLGEIRGRVLDIGCGGGRHLVPLIERGVEVTGLDISPGALSVCRERGAEALILGDVIQAPMPARGFETALLFGNNIGMGGTPEGIMRMLSRLRRHISETVILVSVDVSATRSPQHLAYRNRNLALGLSPGSQLLRIEHDGRVGPWFRWLHPRPDELRLLAACAGWSVARLDASPRGPYAAVLKPF